MKKTKKIVYPALVKQEAKNLKKFATKRELDKLNFDRLVPENAERCIYGQMTGSCWNGRAIQLIEKSCSRVYNEGQEGNSLRDCKLNGSPKKKQRHSYYSPIEVFIYKDGNMENGANERLIKYLKGEIRTL